MRFCFQFQTRQLTRQFKRPIGKIRSGSLVFHPCHLFLQNITARRAGYWLLLLLNEKRYRVYQNRLYTRYVLNYKQLLLNFNFSASFFELRFNLFCFFFGNAFFDSFRCAINQILSLFQTQTGNVFHYFHYLQFRLARALQDHVERRFLSSSGATVGSRSSGNGNSSSSGLNSVFFLQNIGKFVYFFNCQVNQLLS